MVRQQERPVLPFWRLALLSSLVTDGTLRTGRLICAITAVVYPVYRIAEAPVLGRIDDPLGLRLAMTALVVALLGASYASAFVRARFRALMRAFVYLTTAHVFGLLVLNDLDQAVAIGVFVVLACFIAAAPHLMSSVRQLVTYMAFVVALAAAAVAAVDEPRVPAGYFLLSVLAVSALAFVSVRGQLVTLQRLVDSERDLRSDVEVRERTEAALRDSEARATALLDANPDVLLRLGSGATILDVRASEAKPLGRALGGSAGRRLDDVLQGATPGSVAAATDAVLASGRPASLSAECPANGATLHVELRLARTHGNECLAVARDVTQEREIEARLRMADRLVSLGTLASGVAHEINNPLAYVNANVDFALATIGRLPRQAIDAFDRGEVEDALREAADGGRRIANIVSSLKQQTREDDEPLSAVDVHEALEAAVRMLESHLRYRTTLQVSLDRVPPVVANSQRLVQVLVNLLTNALDALPERPSSENLVRVTAAVLPAGRVAIDVSDTGTGIPEPVLHRIFDPFFTTKAQGAGTGLGLYLCHQFVASFGGSIGVHSTSREGTTMRILLDPAHAPGEALDEAPPPSLPRSRILIVDDEPLVARAIGRCFRGHDLEVADDGQRALELCREGWFDLILCDMMMPRMDGAAFYRALVTMRPEQVARVAFMTGGAFTPGARRFLDTVRAPRLDKPIDSRDLLAVARAIVGPSGPGPVRAAS